MSAADGVSDDRPAPDAASRESREIRRAFVLLALVVVCLVAVYLTPVRHWFVDEDGRARLADWFRSLGALGPEVFVLGGAILVAVGVPRLVFAVLGGALYDVWLGFLLSVLATLLGSIVTFWFGRRLGHAFVERRLAQRSRRLRSFFALVERHGIAGNVLLRIAPVGNCFVTNLLLSLSPVKFGHFVIGTAIGLAPHSFVAALFGSSTQGQLAARWISAAVLFVVISIVYVRLRRRSRLGQELEKDLAAPDPTDPPERGA